MVPLQGSEAGGVIALPPTPTHEEKGNARALLPVALPLREEEEGGGECEDDDDDDDDEKLIPLTMADESIKDCIMATCKALASEPWTAGRPRPPVCAPGMEATS